MNKHPGRWFLYLVGFLLIVLSIGAGPIGWAVLVMAGVPIALFLMFEGAAHSSARQR